MPTPGDHNDGPAYYILSGTGDEIELTELPENLLDGLLIELFKDTTPSPEPTPQSATTPYMIWNSNDYIVVPDELRYHIVPRNKIDSTIVIMPKKDQIGTAFYISTGTMSERELLELPMNWQNITPATTPIPIPDNSLNDIFHITKSEVRSITEIMNIDFTSIPTPTEILACIIEGPFYIKLGNGKKIRFATGAEIYFEGTHNETITNALQYDNFDNDYGAGVGVR